MLTLSQLSSSLRLLLMVLLPCLPLLSLCETTFINCEVTAAELGQGEQVDVIASVDLQ